MGSCTDDGQERDTPDQPRGSGRERALLLPRKRLSPAAERALAEAAERRAAAERAESARTSGRSAGATAPSRRATATGKKPASSATSDPRVPNRDRQPRRGIRLPIAVRRTIESVSANPRRLFAFILDINTLFTAGTAGPFRTGPGLRRGTPSCIRRLQSTAAASKRDTGMARFSTLKATFASDDRGSVTFIFALLMLVVVLAAGASIDYARMLHARFNLSAAADAAHLPPDAHLARARGRTARSSNWRRPTSAPTSTKAMTSAPFGDLSVRSIASRAGEVDAAVNVPMTLTRVAGFDNVEIPVAAESIAGQHEIELAMVLDVTGSMGSPASKSPTCARPRMDWSSSSCSRTTARPSRVRIALAPYAASVNAGPLLHGGYRARRRRHRLRVRARRRGAFRETRRVRLPHPRHRTGRRVSRRRRAAADVEQGMLTAQIDGLRASGSDGRPHRNGLGLVSAVAQLERASGRRSRPEATTVQDIKAVLLTTDGEFNTAYVRANGSSAVAGASALRQHESTRGSPSIRSATSSSARPSGCCKTAPRRPRTISRPRTATRSRRPSSHRPRASSILRPRSDPCTDHRVASL